MGAELVGLIVRQVAFVGLLAGPIILVVFVGRQRGWNQTWVFITVLGWAVMFLLLNAYLAEGAIDALPQLGL
ncbi:MAG: hypothetical protein AAGH60_14915 [Pseudomonadota bacterium]